MENKNMAQTERQASPSAELKPQAEPIPFSIYQPMFSASGDAAERKYITILGKSGRRWVVADQPNAADNIYVDGGAGSRGMGGRTLTFELSDGGSVDLIGPWKTTADGLYSDTGYDARDTYSSAGIVALEREGGKEFYAPDLYRGVLHHDTERAIGPYDRINQIAQRLADDHGRTVYFAKVTHGGGQAGTCKPTPSPEAQDGGEGEARPGGECENDFVPCPDKEKCLRNGCVRQPEPEPR